MAAPAGQWRVRAQRQILLWVRVQWRWPSPPRSSSSFSVPSYYLTPSTLLVYSFPLFVVGRSLLIVGRPIALGRSLPLTALLWSSAAPRSLSPSLAISHLALIWHRPHAFGRSSLVFGRPSLAFSHPSLVFGHPSLVFGRPSPVFGRPSLAFSHFRTSPRNRKSVRRSEPGNSVAGTCSASTTTSPLLACRTCALARVRNIQIRARETRLDQPPLSCLRPPLSLIFCRLNLAYMCAWVGQWLQLYIVVHQWGGGHILCISCHNHWITVLYNICISCYCYTANCLSGGIDVGLSPGPAASATWYHLEAGARDGRSSNSRKVAPSQTFW
jgi:hypothetical protein